MKAFPFPLAFACVVVLVASFFISHAGQKALLTALAVGCAAVFGARIGASYKKNLENN